MNMDNIVGKLKKLDPLALSTAIMTALCAVAMILPEFLNLFKEEAQSMFWSMLLLFMPILVFGFVAGHRRNQKRRNSLFFVKVAAVSQFVIATLALILIKIVQVQDDFNEGSNLWAYLWIISAIVTITLYIKVRKNELQDDNTQLKFIDHLWAVLPLILFTITFFLNIIITANSLHLFYYNIPPN